MKVGNFALCILVDGKPIDELIDPVADQIWIPAQKGEEFSLLLANASGERVAAIPSIDGLSVGDGQPASFQSPGYFLRPHSHIVVPGWRLNSGAVARFQFGTAAEGYARTMGHSPLNVGVIAAAFQLELAHAATLP